MIPPEIREKYRTVWEIPMRNLIDMAADRGIYICQAKFEFEVRRSKLFEFDIDAFLFLVKGFENWNLLFKKKGASSPQQFTIEPEKVESTNNLGEEVEEEICEMCSA